MGNFTTKMHRTNLVEGARLGNPRRTQNVNCRNNVQVTELKSRLSAAEVGTVAASVGS
jgi:hypothetical protein